MEFLMLPAVILLLAILWRLEKLQGDVSAVKAQNEILVKALGEKSGAPKPAPNNKGEDTL